MFKFNLYKTILSLALLGAASISQGSQDNTAQNPLWIPHSVQTFRDEMQQKIKPLFDQSREQEEMFRALEQLKKTPATHHIPSPVVISCGSGILLTISRKGEGLVFRRIDLTGINDEKPRIEFDSQLLQDILKKMKPENLLRRFFMGEIEKEGLKNLNSTILGNFSWKQYCVHLFYQASEGPFFQMQQIVSTSPNYPDIDRLLEHVPLMTDLDNNVNKTMFYGQSWWLARETDPSINIFRQHEKVLRLKEEVWHWPKNLLSLRVCPNVPLSQDMNIKDMHERIRAQYIAEFTFCDMYDYCATSIRMLNTRLELDSADEKLIKEGHIEQIKQIIKWLEECFNEDLKLFPGITTISNKRYRLSSIAANAKTFSFACIDDPSMYFNFEFCYDNERGIEIRVAAKTKDKDVAQLRVIARSAPSQATDISGTPTS